MLQTDTATKVSELRAKLDHPIIDGDGHLIEPFGLFLGYVDKVGGEGAADRLRDTMRAHPLNSMGDADRGDQRGAWWGTTNDARDLATVMIPDLLAERLEEIGMDYAVLYPTLGLALPTMPDDEMRRLACRAINTMNAELMAPHTDRLTVSAVLPMHTPEEAMAELEHCVKTLGYKVAMVPPGVARPWPAHPDAFPAAAQVDRFGIDSAHDYDPLWQTFCDLGVAVTSHGAIGLRYLDSGRRSPTNYMFNHIMGHAYQQGEFAKSLVMGGVTRRFPQLRFGFLECGAGWAADLLHSLEEHWEKRNAEGLKQFDPTHLDRAELFGLVEQYGLNEKIGRPVLAGMGSMRDGVRGSEGGAPPAWARDEFEAAGFQEEQEIADVFDRQFFFGCEADDRSVYRALDGRGNPFGLRLKAFFSSDIGHWDVPDIKEVVLVSRCLVDRGLLTDADYRDFVCTYPVLLHGGMNPAFFDGTVVEETARKILANA